LKNRIRIIRPASREKEDLLSDKLKQFEKIGFITDFEDIPIDPSWGYSSGSQENRASALEAALFSKEAQLILAARGGYGCSDLLPLIDFQKFEHEDLSLIIGFSDISALHSAFYTKLGWPSLHAPMPATALWDFEAKDVASLICLMNDFSQGKILRQSLSVKLIPTESISRVSQKNPALKGKLFGGCFSVLTNMIGTPYFPKDLSNHIIFIEDLQENPARLLRYLNQWIQSGAFEKATALVVGYLKDMGEGVEDNAEFVLREIAKRCAIPVFHSKDFGHITPNTPLLIGSDATIKGNELVWTFDPRRNQS